MKEEQKSGTMEELKKQVEETIKVISDNGIKSENIENLYKLVDIHKDISNEEYWKIKEEGEMKNMRYSNYGREMNEQDFFRGEYNEGGNYGRRGGRYSEGSYGRRGVKGTGRGRYRGEELMDEMMFHYGNYSENAASGQYGGENEKMESLSNLMESAYEYFKELKEYAESPDEIKMIQHYFKKIGQI